MLKFIYKHFWKELNEWFGWEFIFVRNQYLEGYYVRMNKEGEDYVGYYGRSYEPTTLFLDGINNKITTCRGFSWDSPLRIKALTPLMISRIETTDE